MHKRSAVQGPAVRGDQQKDLIRKTLPMLLRGSPAEGEKGLTGGILPLKFPRMDGAEDPEPVRISCIQAAGSGAAVCP